MPEPTSRAGPEIRRLSDLSPQQWRSGIAAWLGWLFDGLDMHLYTLVATPFVAQLLVTDNQRDASVGYLGSVIQAAFLVGWALGGGLFGRVGDRFGRALTLMLTILTYALFTGLAFFAQTWWHLLICRFLAALGIGGEWAVGAALLSETWPRRWGPWIAAVLQSAVNCGVLLAMVAVFFLSIIPYPNQYYQYRCVFLVGVLPALLVLWIRRSVPEPEEWHTAKTRVGHAEPRIRDLFRGKTLSHHAVDDCGLCVVSVGPLGVHVLVPATPAQPARSGCMDGTREDSFPDHGHGVVDVDFDCGELSWPGPSRACSATTRPSR